MSNEQDKHFSSDPTSQLAGEFALGVLSGDRLQEALALYGEDTDFREAVEQWHERLSPMLNEVAPVTPPADGFEKISARLFDNNNEAAPQAGFWNSIGLWRGLGISTSALAAALIAAAVYLPNWLSPAIVPDGPRPDYVAALNLAENKPTFLIRINAQTGSLGIKSANLQQGVERVPELWVIPGDGKARSLGVLKSDGATNLSVETENLQHVKPGVTLAITLEPPGGAPDGLPTGEVIAAGTLQEI